MSSKITIHNDCPNHNAIFIYAHPQNLCSHILFLLQSKFPSRPRSLAHQNGKEVIKKWLCATSTLLLHGCLWSCIACGRKEMQCSSYCDNHSRHQPLWWPRTVQSYQSPGPTPSKEESRWKMRGTELGILFCLHLRELTVWGSFLAKGQMCIADFLISSVENMPLPPRIKSLDTLDGSASHWVSLPTEITHCSLYSSTDTNFTKPGISFPFCLKANYWEWEVEMNGEVGSGMQIWWRVWGVRRTRQGGNKCYTVMDELLTYTALCLTDCVYLLAMHLLFPSWRPKWKGRT